MAPSHKTSTHRQHPKKPKGTCVFLAFANMSENQIIWTFFSLKMTQMDSFIIEILAD